MPTRITGLPAVVAGATRGVEASSPPNITQHKFDPTTTDYFNFNTGDLWLNSQPDVPSKGLPVNSIYRLWMLVAKVQNTATWIEFSGNSGSVLGLQGAINGVPNGAVVTPSLGIIQINNTDTNLQPIAGSPNPNNLNINFSRNITVTGKVTINNADGVTGLFVFGATGIVTQGTISTQSGGISAGDTENNTNPADLNMIKSRNNGAVHNGDSLGALNYFGNDGTSSAISGAAIIGTVTGAIAAGSIPTTLSFWTTPVGGSLTQRASINNAGNVAILTPDSGSGLTVNGSGIAINAAGGSIKAFNNLYTAGDDGTGANATISFTNANSTTISTGTGTVKMSSANSANNAAWIKIYINTTAYFIPAWLTNAP